MQRPNINRPHVCSFCPKSYETLQALGGHMTCHRDEMERMRNQHEAFMKNQRAKSTDITETSSHQCYRPLQMHADQDSKIPFVPLIPNTAYWESYRRFGLEPWAINFLRDVGPREFSSDRMRFEPLARQLNQMWKGSCTEIIDLTLKL